MILNVHQGRFKTLRRGDKELSKCFQSVQDAQRIRGRQDGLLLRDLQVITLVFAKLLDRLGRVFASDDQACGRSRRSHFADPPDCILQARLGVAGDCNTDRGANP